MKRIVGARILDARILFVIAATVAITNAQTARPSFPPITGLPYTAQQEVQTVQTLGDGTHMTQPTQTVALYRDSMGRTRNEYTIAPRPGQAIPNISIEIEDPVAGYRYRLDPQTRVAHREVLPPMRRPGTVQTTSTATPPVTPPDSNRPQTSRESLGTKTFNGIQAEGNRITMVWPVGAVGNDRPITNVSETWISRELGLVVSRTSSDPRTGDNTLKLLNISRAEPDPSLFQPPSDYRIEDTAQGR